MHVRASLVYLVLGFAFLSGCNRDLQLPPTPQFASLAGAIDTEGRVPAGDNEIRLINAATGVRADQRTDADGGFLFGGLPAGPYLVQADVPGFAPLREGPFPVVSGQTLDVGTFKLAWLGTSQSEGTILGKVVVAGGSSGSMDAGAPDAGELDGGGGRPSDAMGATVTLSLERMGADPVKVAETPVDAFGTFSARVPPGRYRIDVAHPWYVSANRAGIVLGEAQVLSLTEPLVLQLNPAEVSGEVVLEVDDLTSGTGTEPGVGVAVNSDTGSSTTSDLSGRYVLPGLAAGARRVFFTKAGYHDPEPNRTLTLAAGEKTALPTIRLLLDRGDLAGRVRMSDGSQLDSVSVFIAGAADAGTGAYSAQVARSQVDPTVGDFVLRDVPVGRYNVVARRTNYVDATSPSIEVRSGQLARLTDELRLARLQGDFLIDDGDPSNTPGFTRSRDVTLVLSNVTNAAEYRVAEGTQQALATQAWQPYATNRIAFQLSAGDGNKAVYLQIKNTMGNEGAPLAANITLDTTAPASLTLELGSGTGFTRIADPIPVTVSAVDQGGVALVRLASVELDGGYEVNDAGVLLAPAQAYVRDTSFDRPSSADGVQAVVAQFIDNAGNASAPVVSSIVIDTVPPTGSISVLRGARATLDGYTNTLLVDLAQSWGTEPNGGFVQVRVANDAMDLGNAVAQPTRPRASWFLDAQGEGTKTVHYVFVDAAGNQGGAGQATIIYDATNPQLSATLTSPTPTSNPVVNLGLSSVEASPWAPDAGLLLAESPLFTNAQAQTFPSNNTATFTLSAGDGPRTVYLRARDAAGNEGSASVSLELDTTPPANVAIGLVGAWSDGTPSSTLTATSTVTVNLTHAGATRVLLGDASMTSCPAVSATWRALTGNSIANHPLPGSGGTRTVTACFADGAGNTAGPVSASITFDGAAPTGCQLALSGLRTDGTAAGSSRTALRSIPFSLTNCDEQPLEIALTEQAAVSCAATAAGLTWAPYSATANQLTLSSVDGAKTVRGCVRDAARNTVAFTAASITLDSTAPSNARISLNGGASSINASALDGGVAVVSVSGTAVGASQWAVAEEGVTPSTFVDVTTQNPVSLALSAGDGVKTVKALFRDDLGNTIPVEVADSIEVDTTAPTLTSFTLSGALADGTASTGFTTTADVTASLAQTGATTVFFSNTSITSCPTTGHVPLTGSTAQVTLGSPGNRTVWACVGDAAGNVSAVRTAGIVYDGTAPGGCALVLTGYRSDTGLATSGAAAGRTGRRDVTATLTTCNEQPTQIFLTDAAVSCTNANSFQWQQYDGTSNTVSLTGVDGSKTVRACVRDAARNTQAVTAAVIVLDTTAPTGASVSLKGGAAYFNRADWVAAGNTNVISVTGTAAGASEWSVQESGTPAFVAFSSPGTTSVTFSAGDGTKTVRAWFRDEVGNGTAAEVTDTIEVDTAAPTLSGVVLTGTLADGTASTVSTSSLNVTATLTQGGGTRVAVGNGATLACATASYGSLSGTTVTTTLPNTPGTLSVSVCVADEAGNTSSSATDSIVLDTAGPATCTLAMTGRTASGGATALDKTALRDVAFTFTGCSEPPTDYFLTEAATVNCSANLDWKPLIGGDLHTLSAVDGLKTVRGCVRDSTRNATAFSTDSITLDTTPPTSASVSIRGGAAYFNRADFTAAGSTNTMSVTGTAQGASEWALAETGSPSTFTAFTTPGTSSFVFSTGDGSKTIRALFRDDIGNVTAAEVTDTIEVDTVVPTLTALSITGSLADGQESTVVTANTQVTASFTQSGATRILFGDGSLASCSTSGYADITGTTASTTLGGTGATRTLRACVADLAGNTAGPLSATIAFDSSAPTGCQLVLTGRTAGGANTTGATAELTALRDVGVSLTSCNETATEIYLTESASVTCSAVNSFQWQPLTASTQFTLSSVDLLKTVRGCVRDAANNTLSFTADTITLDTTPPTAGSVTLAGGAQYFNLADSQAAGNTNTVTVSGSATGAVEWAVAESATPTTFGPLTSTTLVLSSGQGTRTVSALFRDAVGNVTPVAVTDSIEIDTVPPVFSSVALTGTLADGTASETTTVTPNVQVSLGHSGGAGLFVGDGALAACPTTGYVSFSGASASITLPGSSPGTRAVRICLSDVAGNVAGFLGDSLVLDATAPTSCALTLLGRRTNGVATSGATADKTALATVGVSLGSCVETPTEIYLAEVGSVSCSATASLAWQPFTAGATNFILTGGDASKTVVGCVRDAARNVASITSDAITLDTTAPTGASVSLHGGAAYFNRAAYLAAPNLNRMNVTGTASGATEWAFAENAAPTSFVAFTSPTSTPTTFSTGDGTKLVRALFRDDVGNTTAAESTDTIEVDTDAPVLTAITLSGTLADGVTSTTLTTTSSVTVNFNQTGGTLVAVGDSPFTCPATTAGFASFNGTTFAATLGGSGASRTLGACVSDSAGNTSAVQTRSIGFDATLPSGCVLTLVGRRTDGTSTASTVPEKSAQASITASLSACAETPSDIYLLETTGPLSCPAAGSAVWQSLNGGLALSTALSAGDGLKTMRACVRDAARNVSATSISDTITLDTTPPTGASVSLHGGAEYFNRAAWLAALSQNRMDVTGTATGATEWAFAESSTPSAWFNFTSSPTVLPNTFSAGEGTKRVNALFRDDVGNTTTSEATDTIEVDITAPVVSGLTLRGTLGDGNVSTLVTTSTTVTADVIQSGGTRFNFGDGSFTCPPAGPWTAFNGSTASITLPGSGTPRTVRMCVADAAGNPSNLTVDTIEYDALSASGCTLVLEGRKVDGTTTTASLAELTALRDVRAVMTGCSEPNLQMYLTEGAAPTCTSAGTASVTWQSASSFFQLSTGDGEKTVRGCVRDSAFNVGTLTADTITLDTTAPESPSVSVDSSGGYSNVQARTASGTAVDAVDWHAFASPSPVAPWPSNPTWSTYSTSPSTLPVTLPTPDGAKYVFARFRDSLGNMSRTVSATVTLDMTPPSAPVLLTVDGQNRSARLFWDPSTDTSGIASYELLAGDTAPPTSVRATTAGTATDGYVLNLENRVDQSFAVRAVDNAGNRSGLSAVRSTSIGWRRTAVSPNSVYPIRPLDVAVRGSDVFVTFMETDTNWSGVGGNLKLALSHDRGATWSFVTLDADFGSGRQVAPIAFTDSAVWVASVANMGFSSDVTAGEVKVWRSTNNGDSFTNVSPAALNSSANYGKVDGLGLLTSGDSMRLTYLVASSTAVKQLNMVSASGLGSLSLQTDYDVSFVWGSAPYQVTNGVRSCSGNFSSLTMWRDRSSSTVSSANLRALTHYYLPDVTFNESAAEGRVDWATSGFGTGQEVGSFDLACTSLPETMQAYVVYDRAPAAAWAVGSDGTILRYDDTAWVTAPSPTPRQLYSVQDVWALGQGYSAAGDSYSLILRWNGSSWEEIKTTVANGAFLYDSATVSANNVYAVGSSGTILRWDGSAWAAQTSGTVNSLYGVYAASSTYIVAVGSGGTILRSLNGTTWTAQTSTTTTALRAVWGSANNNIWAVGDNGLTLRWNGSTWSQVATPVGTPNLYSIWGSGPNDVWAVGLSGAAIRWNGSAWSTWSTGTVQTLNEVSGVSSNDVWAVGNNGTAIRFNGTSWSIQPTETTASLNSVWWGGSSGGPAATLYGRRKLGSLQNFQSPATALRTDADRSFSPRVWAGGRNVYVLYRSVDDKLWMGESTDEASSFPRWTTLESGPNKGQYAVLSGENSSDVAVAFTDVNASTFTVMLQAAPALKLVPQAGVGSSSVTWATAPGIDRYQVDSDPDGVAPWANVDFTSLTQATLPVPPGNAPYVQVRSVDARNMPGNTGELWQLRPFNDSTLTASSSSVGNSNSGGIVAYNNEALIWPPTGSVTPNFLVYRTNDYGQTWTTHNAFTTSFASSARAIAGINGRAGLFHLKTTAPNELHALVYNGLNSTTPTDVTIQTGVTVSQLAAKASVDNLSVVVAYLDSSTDTIRVATSNNIMSLFSVRTSIVSANAATHTIGALEVAKVDASQSRIVITWREYSNTGDPRTDLIRGVESTDFGTTWGTQFTIYSGTSSFNSEFADYEIGNTLLSGANNGAYSVLARTTEANDFNNRPANLWLTVTGTDHSTSVSAATYVHLKLDPETVDTRTVDAYANGDGHYLAWRSQTLDGTTAKLRFAYCFSECHLVSSWELSLLKVWNSFVKDQGRVVNMTVGQASGSFDPAIYVLYQEASGSTRNLKVLSRGVHRRTR